MISVPTLSIRRLLMREFGSAMLNCAPSWMGLAMSGRVTRVLCPAYTCRNRVTIRPNLLHGLREQSLAQPSPKWFSQWRPALMQPPASISSSSKDVAAADPSPAPLSLPDYCAGCGVKLQAEDPDRPGWDDMCMYGPRIRFARKESAA